MLETDGGAHPVTSLRYERSSSQSEYYRVNSESVANLALILLGLGHRVTARRRRDRTSLHVAAP